MRRWVFLEALLLVSVLQAQTFGPTAKYAWDMTAAPTAAEAAGYPYTVKDDVAPNGRPLHDVTCVAAAVGQTCIAPLLPYTDGLHQLTLTYVLGGVMSAPSNTATFTYQTPTTPPSCGTISVQTYTATVPVGTQGNVAFQVLNSAKPIIDVQVRFGSQVVGEVGPGTVDLRSLMGLYFSVPRMPGAYNLTVYAKDNVGCSVVTTATRTVTVQ